MNQGSDLRISEEKKSTLKDAVCEKTDSRGAISHRLQILIPVSASGNTKVQDSEQGWDWIRM